MRFYEFEAKQLLAKQGVPTYPHPTPTRRGTPLPVGEGLEVRENKAMHSYEFECDVQASVGTDLQVATTVLRE